jgi:sterol desaturase/sphingolipid hydroxylase (fatty acid hydroxylase superfamily)
MTIAFRNWLLRNRPFLLFGPTVAAIGTWLWVERRLGVAEAMGLWFGGLVAWSLLEWLAHRAMHLRTSIGWLTRLQDNVHLRHHREPDDLEHSVIRLRASIPLAALLFLIGLLAWGELHRANAFHAGLLTGYMFYEFVHLTAHSGVRIPGLRALHRYHNLHHYADMNRGFGVTSALWDWTFRTLPVSKRV